VDDRAVASGAGGRCHGGAQLTALNTIGWNRIRYSLYAPIYDWIVRLDRARAEAIDGLGLQEGDRVLIPGAGTGQDLPLLPSGVDVVAGDIAPGMVRRLHRKASAYLGRQEARPDGWAEGQAEGRAEGRAEVRGRGRVEIRELDAQALGFPDDSFDAVLLHLVVAIVPDPRACLEEAVRVLRPGGRLSILDKFAPEGRVSRWRRILNPLTESMASSVSRQLGVLLEGLPVRIRDRRAVALGGFLEVVILTKEGAADPGIDPIITKREEQS